MWQWLTQVENLQSIEDARFALRAAWPGVAVVLMVLGAVCLGLWFYSGYGIAAGRRRRLVLGGLRAGLIGFLVLLLFEPVVELSANVARRSGLLVLVDASQSMRLADSRASEADCRRAAMARGIVGLDQRDAQVTMRLRERVGRPKRLELAASLLGPDGVGLLRQWGAEHQVHLYRFGRDLGEVDRSEGISLQQLALGEQQADATQLGAALRQAAERHVGQNLAGIVVLTDGANNTGPDPVAIARRLGQQQLPVYCIGLGASAPDDVQIKSALVQEVVFPRDRVPVRVTINSSGYRGRPTVVKLLLNDRTVASRAVNLNGGTQFETFEFQPEASDVGTAQLRVTIGALPDEATLENNQWSRSIVITDKRIRVLYIEGKPRWEYRYLRRVLQRDQRIEVDYYMTEGDPRLAENASNYLSQFPEDAAKAYSYDLVILGDVPSSVFSDRQIQRIEELVSRQGGALLMIAGRQFAPVSYRGTAIEKMLPVRLGDASKPWLAVPDSVYPQLTLSGERSGVARVGDRPGEDRLIWKRVAPLERLADLQGAKPGAAVWVTLSDSSVSSEVYPLVAWHRYGAGRCLYVGCDALWRLRLRTGSLYHERFWSQSIQFVALARLLAGRDRTRLETDKRRYVTGEPVRVYATVQDEAWEPLVAEDYTVVLRPMDSDRARREVKLAAVPERDGIFEATLNNLREGQYAIEPAEGGEQEVVAKFAVEAASVEFRESALQVETLKNIAEASGGKFARPDALPEFLEALKSNSSVVRRKIKLELWDLPLAYILVILWAGTEWYLRRQASLP